MNQATKSRSGDSAAHQPPRGTTSNLSGEECNQVSVSVSHCSDSKSEDQCLTQQSGYSSQSAPKLKQTTGRNGPRKQRTVRRTAC